ncbi:MAG: TauD/TfdA family dioxygenase [Alphaproteobacteria bacterium]|nr:TauD/TfdA family dioxygenase [Alphaproteobacteria bacterium]
MAKREAAVSLDTRLLGNGFAVEIMDLDLGRLDDATLEAVRREWLANKVAVFRDQDLPDAALVDFTERMGPLFVHFRDQFHAPDRPEIMYVSNLKEAGRNLGALGDGDLEWHTDQTYTPRPVFGTLLYAIETPADGGATYFGDLAAAYAAMPAALKAEVDGRTAVYTAMRNKTTRLAPLRQDQIDGTPDQRHPLVRTHPYLDRKALYLSPSHMIGIDDLSEAESLELVARLTEWAERPEFVYRHDWRVGDVVIWDNTSVMHRRDGFPPDQRRFLKRTGFHLPEELGVPF